MRSVEFLYDFVSAPSYMAWTQIDAIAREANAQVIMTPVFCAGIFKEIGNPGPLAIPAKRTWYAHDLQLWAKKRGITLRPNPHAPIRTLPLMRGVFVARERDEFDRYSKAIWDAIWLDGKNMSDPAIVNETLRAAGLDIDAYAAGIEREDIKTALRDSTQQAVQRGAFGVPTFFVGDELFFGQDRLEFVRDALHA
ncbi:MAG TPA: 2-hydroxychromene-2-carboxylate isomerase [Burkholderiales bacterium]|nr:2-hydroxychromene-2-carboxylate isomerase [Burkholderiales bacterium]